MTYFLDFDRTLFDTPAFKRELSLRRRTLAAFIKHDLFAFAPQELRKYLYPDVHEFLEKHGQESIVVTFAIQMFVIAKVANALSDTPLKAIFYSERRKGHLLKKLCTQHDEPFVFVDDMPFQLESVEKHCPHIQLFEMRRDEEKGDGRWPVIRSLAELPSI